MRIYCNRSPRPISSVPYVALTYLLTWFAAIQNARADKLIDIFSASCGLFESKRIRCWGMNESGQVGTGSTFSIGADAADFENGLPFVDLGENLSVIKVSIGKSHVCALLDDGHVKCWGSNAFGQLGYGDNANRGDHPNEMGENLPFIDFGNDVLIHDIASGSNHNCVLTVDRRKAFCFGNNSKGQLGIGTNKDVGSVPNEIGTNLKFATFGQDGIINSIHSGSAAQHTCVIVSDGRLQCWGDNTWFQLGYGDNRNRGDEENEMAENLPLIDLGNENKVVAVELGEGHTCVLLESKAVKCWGRNDFGQLGIGNIKPVGDNPQSMGNALQSIKWGNNMYATQIAVGDNFTCGLLNNNSVKCYGKNIDGSLGTGDSINRGVSQKTIGFVVQAIDLGYPLTKSKLSCHIGHCCVLFDDSRAKCWGRNSHGQLALGDTKHRGDDAKEMGVLLPFAMITPPVCEEIVQSGTCKKCKVLKKVCKAF